MVIKSNNSGNIYCLGSQLSFAQVTCKSSRTLDVVVFKITRRSIISLEDSKSN